MRELAANGTNTATIKVPDTLAADYTLTLPVDDGTSGQVLTTDGNGVLSWSSAAAGGETNTASNVTGSSGVGVFKQKTGVDLEFKSLLPGSTKLSISGGASDVTLDVVESNINHDNLSGFVANEHVDHSTVSIATAASSGLTGGGDLTATRNLAVNINGTTAETVPASADEILMYDTSATALRKITRSNFLTGYLQAAIGTATGDVMGADAVPNCTSTQKLQMSAGPVYTWSCVSEATGTALADADGNTKIQVEESANEDKIRFDTNGTERMIIDDTGKVGIGTTSPTYKMQVAGNNLAVALFETSGANKIRINNNVIDALNNAGSGGTDLILNPGGVYSGGNVGIGTTNPGTLLDVAGAITSRPYGTGAGQTGQVIMRELAANGTNTATLRVPDTLAADYTLTLPVDDGTSGQVLTTDGNGVLSWSSTAAGGETNTASNVTGSTGVGVFKQKTGADLEFKSLLPGSNKLSVSGGASDVTLDVVEANINHDNLSGFVANEHVDHSAVSIATAANSGLTGGGDLTATRNLAVDINGTTAETVPASADEILMYDASATALRKITRSNFLTGYLQAAIGTATGDVMGADSVPNCTSTQKLQMSAGPVYTWSCVSEATGTTLADADGNTKIQVEESANEDKIRFDTNGTERMIIDNSGNVGIGTTSPNAKMEIVDNASNQLTLSSTDTSSAAAPAIALKGRNSTGTGDDWAIIGTTGQKLVLSAAGAWTTNQHLVINNTGDVGIGTTNPTYKLEVTDGAIRINNTVGTDADLRFSNNASNAGKITYSSQELQFTTAGSQKMVIQSGGSVGIGTTVPGTKLDVDGAITSRPYGTSAGETGQVILRELAANGTNTATLRVPDTLAADYTLTLPVDDGTSGQVLTTDGNGVLSWSSTAAGGETNTASNVTGSTGVGLYKTKSGVDLQFKSLLPGSTKLSISGGASDVTLDVVEANINHDNLSGFVANEHVDHSTVSIATAASSGLTGGGDLTATRNLAVNINGTTAETVPASADEILMYDASATALRKITRSNFLTGYLQAAIGTATGDVMGADAVPNCTSTQKLQMSAGPVYTWSCVSEATGTALADADNNTKIQVEESANEDKIRFDTAGSERMIIDDAGKVGIGTSAPSATLEVSGTILSSGAAPSIRFYESDQSSGSRSWYTGVNGMQYILLQGRSDDFSSGGGDSIIVDRGAGNAMVALNANKSATSFFNLDFITGRVGIGTTVPGTKLDVDGAITSRPYGTSAGETGQVILRELAANGTNAATIKVPDTLAADYTLTLPVDDGTASQVLTTDGSGVLSWATPSAATSVSASAGSAASPSIGFSGDPDTGFYSNGANTIGVTAGTANIFNLSSAGLVSPTAGGGVVTTANGLEAAPTFSFAGDTDTGWWHPAANTMAASTGGTERMRIDSSGRVAIGATSTSYDLKVARVGTNPEIMLEGSADSAAGVGKIPYLYIRSYAGASTGSAGAPSFRFSRAGGVAGSESFLTNGTWEGNLTGYVWNGSSYTDTSRLLFIASEDHSASGLGTDIVFRAVANGTTADVEAMRIRNDGKVGIGTTTPNSLLDVNDPTGGIMTISRGDTTATANDTIGRIDFWNNDVQLTTQKIYGNIEVQAAATTATDAAAGNMIFRTTGTTVAGSPVERMRIDSSGNVGIGTTSPGTNLHVRYAASGQTPTNVEGLFVEGSGSANTFYVLQTATTGGGKSLSVTNAGNVGIGTTAPAAVLHIKAGTATASTAPLKFTAGTNMTTPENGAIEFDGTDLFLTTSGTRKKLAQSSTSGDMTGVGNITGTGAVTIATGGTTNDLNLTSTGTSGNVNLNPGTSTGIVNINSSVASTSSTTGALVVDGGVGVAGAMNVGTSITVPLIYGSTASGGDITINSTSHATKGDVILNPTTGNVGIGTTAPSRKLHVRDDSASEIARFQNATANSDPYILIQNDATYWTAGVFGGDSDSFKIRNGSDVAVITATTAGNVGIGTTSPNVKLHVVETDTTAASSYAGAFIYNGEITANGTKYGKGAQFQSSKKVSAGVTDSGYSMGISSAALRNLSTTSDNGTIAGIYSGYLQYGHYSSDGAATPVTTNAYGIYITPYISTGTITNMYDLYLAAPATGGTVTNQYGVYQLGSSKINYFAGNVGIGTTAPSSQLHLQSANPELNIESLATAVGSSSSLTFGHYQAADATPTGKIYSYLVNGGAATRAGDLRFQTATAGALADRMTIDSTGNVGIGTTDPVYKLDVFSSTSIPLATNRSDDDDLTRGAAYFRRSRSSATAPGAGFGVTIYTALEGFTNDSYGNASSIDTTWESAQTNDTTDRDASMSFNVAQNAALSEKMRITSSGNVGIGTTSPTSALHISKTATDTSGTVIGSYMNHTAAPAAASTGLFYGSETRSTSTGAGANDITGLYGNYNYVAHTATGAVTTMVAGQNISQNTSSGDVTNMYGTYTYAQSSAAATSNITNMRGTYSRALQSADAGTITNAYGIVSTVENPGLGAITNGYAIYANTTNGGGGLVNGYGVYIANIEGNTNQYGLYQAGASDKNYFAGDVGIGTASPGYPLEVVTTATTAAARFKNAATAASSPVVIFATNATAGCTLTAGGQLQCTSDVRLKKDITNIDGILDNLLSLDSVRYHLKSDNAEDPLHIGYKAQQLQEHFPEVVGQDEQGYLQVNYSNFVAIVSQALKEFYHKWMDDSQKIHRELASKADTSEVKKLKSELLDKDKKMKELDQKVKKFESENQAIKAYICSKDPKAAICK